MINGFKMAMNLQELKYRIKYTWQHKIAFLQTERELLGHNTFGGYTHDLDKVLFWYPAAFVFRKDKTWCHKNHRRCSRHHIENRKTKTRKDYINMIIDWECARRTKPDKPLNAYGTMKKYYPHLETYILPLLKELGLQK